MLKITEKLRGRAGVRIRALASQPRALSCSTFPLYLPQEKEITPEGIEIFCSLNQLEFKYEKTWFRVA